MPNGSGNDGRYTYAWEGPAAGAPSQIAVIWWGAMPEEPDLMVIYNEGWEPFTVTNLSDWSPGDWRVLARSWLGAERDGCELATWQTTCPAAGDRIELEGVQFLVPCGVQMRHDA